MYLAIVSWGYRLARQNPRPLNKTSGPMTQKYAPGERFFCLSHNSIMIVCVCATVVYGFMVLSSISEVGFLSEKITETDPSLKLILVHI